MGASRLSLIGLLIASCSILAAPVAASEETEFLSDLPIVLTPSRLLQPLDEAPAAMTVIDRAMIDASGYRDIGRLLRLVPGMQVGQERGNSQWVTYHGMGNDFPSWMQVLIDGRSVYSEGAFNSVDWSSLPISIDEIERIEVLRGTNSVSYGSNAFLGVINIITRDTCIEPRKQAKLRFGSADISDLAVEFGSASGGSGLRLNAETQHDSGFEGLNDSRSKRLASLRADKRLSNHDEIMIRLATSEVQRGMGYADSTFNNNGVRDAETSLSTLHLQWKHAPGNDEEWWLHYYRNQDRSTDEWLASAQAGAYVPLNRNRVSSRDNLELQHRSRWSDRIGALWGVEWRQVRIDSPFLYYGSSERHSNLQRLFGQLDWKVRDDLNINASGLLEKNDPDPVRFSPRLFGNWKLTDSDTLRLGYAKAWRSPSMFERYGDIRAFYAGQLLVQPFLPNPELKASSIDSLDAGYLGQLGNNTRLDVRLFRERINNFITRVSHPEYTAPLLAATLPSSRYENLGPTVTLSGVEYQLDSHPWEGGRVLFSHSLIHRSSSNQEVTQLTAPYGASLSWMQAWDSQWSSMMSLYTMAPLAGGTGFVPRYQYLSPSYTTLDARLARRFQIDSTQFEVAAVATNLGPRHQEIADRSEQLLHGTDPANRTSPMIWLTLSISLN
jgi:iron complex outermembrane receptor protein